MVFVWVSAVHVPEDTDLWHQLNSCLFVAPVLVGVGGSHRGKIWQECFMIAEDSLSKR